MIIQVVSWVHITAHFVTMAGGVIPAGKVLFIRPQIMYRYIVSAEQKIAHTLDMNLSLLIYNRVNIELLEHHSIIKAIGLLNGDSFDVLISIPKLLIGFAYDYTLTKLGDYSHGSYGYYIGLWFLIWKETYYNP